MKCSGDENLIFMDLNEIREEDDSGEYGEARRKQVLYGRGEQEDQIK